MRRRRALLFPALALAAAAVGAVPASAASAPIRVDFDKTIVDASAGVWMGTVSGDVDGELTTRLLSLETSGPIWHVSFDWIIDGDVDLTARLSGTLHTLTGRVVMNGNVIDGAYLGAQVHEEGQLVDAATLRFEGEIRIFPATH